MLGSIRGQANIVHDAAVDNMAGRFDVFPSRVYHTLSELLGDRR
jgi:hypothetical protein